MQYTMSKHALLVKSLQNISNEETLDPLMPQKADDRDSYLIHQIITRNFEERKVTNRKIFNCRTRKWSNVLYNLSEASVSTF